MRTLLLWSLFEVGLILHVFMQAKASAVSRSNNLSGIKDWLCYNWHSVLVRSALSNAVFAIWFQSPTIFGDFVGKVVPQTGPICFLFGYAVDSFLDKFAATIGITVDVPEVSPPLSEQTLSK